MVTSRRTLTATLTISVLMMCLATRVLAAMVPRSDAAGPFGSAVKGLALSVNLTRRVVRVGEPIGITFRVKNDGPVVPIFRAGAFQEYHLSGTGPDGSAIKLHNRGYVFNVRGPSGLKLDQSNAYKHHEDDLGLMYDFSKRGSYTFNFKTAVALQFHLYDTPYAVLTSNTVTLTVE